MALNEGNSKSTCEYAVSQLKPMLLCNKQFEVKIEFEVYENRNAALEHISQQYISKAKL